MAKVGHFFIHYMFHNLENGLAVGQKGTITYPSSCTDDYPKNWGPVLHIKTKELTDYQKQEKPLWKNLKQLFLDDK